jgi:hypothetical protein
VVDTGSPFLMVDGRCGPAPTPYCFTSPSRSVDMDDKTTEGYGGQDVMVEWRRGEVAFGAPRRPTASLRYSPVNFGVVRGSMRYAASRGAVFLGLVKERAARTRPTLLEQTDIASMRFDFAKQPTLTLARRPLLGLDAVPLVDLRALGSPIAQYACRVERLVVNRQPVELQRPTFAVVDTGTTGLAAGGEVPSSALPEDGAHLPSRTIGRLRAASAKGSVSSRLQRAGLVISDSLYDSDELPLPGAAIREVGVEVLTERGRTTTFSASRAVQRERGDDIPLICTAQQLPWFDGRPRPLGGVGGECDESGCTREGASDKRTPHVLFLGLAFLDGSQLTIDVDDRRMALNEPV